MTEATLAENSSLYLKKKVIDSAPAAMSKGMDSAQVGTQRWLALLVAGLLCANLSLAMVTYWTHDWTMSSGLLRQRLFAFQIGVHFGQWILLLIWMAFGRFRSPWRELVCTLLVFGGSFLLGLTFPQEFVASMSISLMLTAFFWAFYLLLSPVAWLLNIQIEFQKIEQVALRKKRTYGIGSILRWMLLVAIPCELFQLAFSILEHFSRVEQLLVMTIFLGIVIAVTVPFSLLLLAQKRFLLWFGVFLFGGAALIYGVRGQIPSQTVYVAAGLGSAILLNLTLLRWFGLRWMPTAPGC